jgi:hypothetical protein
LPPEGCPQRVAPRGLPPEGCPQRQVFDLSKCVQVSKPYQTGFVKIKNYNNIMKEKDHSNI